MTPLFLTPQEMQELTARKSNRGQIAALRAMGIPFRVNAAGRPVVCRSAVEGQPAPPPAAEVWRPAALGR